MKLKFEKLGNLIEIKKGKKPVFTDNPSNTSHRVLQIDDLRNDNNLKFTDEVSGVFAEKSDVLLAWDGANAGTIGYGKKGFIGSTIARLRAKEGINFSPPFLGSFLQSKFNYLRSKTAGATIPHIDGDLLRNLRVPVFPTIHQIKIAQVLTQAEKFIAQRKESIDLLDKYLESTFLEMFGDPVRNDRHWSTKRLDEISKLERGKFSPRPRNDPSYFNGIYPFIQTGDISKSGNKLTTFNQTLNEQGKRVSKRFEKGTIVTAIVGATIGATAILEIEVYATDSIVGITAKKEFTTSNFLGFTMKFWRPILLNNAPKAARQNINLEILSKLKIIIPTLELQNQFAQIVEKIEALKSQYQRSLQELEQLFGSLSQRAFKGELDLSHMEVSAEEVLQISDTPTSTTTPKSEKRKKEPLRLTQENETALSIWQSQREKRKAGKIPFNSIEGNAVLSTEFTQKAQGFSFQQFEAFLKNEGFDYAYEQVKDFLFEKLEHKELKQYYATQEWMEQRKRTGIDPDQTNFSDDGHIWLVANNARG